MGTPTPTLKLEPGTEAKERDLLGPPPDGGLKAWLTVFGGFLAIFVQFGLSNCFGVFQKHYETDQLQQYTPDEIAWIGSLQLFLLFAGGLVSGRLFDAHGAHVLLIPGSIGFVLSLMLTSLCVKYYQFILAQGVLFGLSSSLIFNPCLAVPTQWFHERRALAMALVVSGSGLGGTLLPIALQRMFDEIGFEWALRTTGFIALALLALANALMRTRLPPREPAPWSSLPAQYRDVPFTLLCCSVAFAYLGLFTPFFFISTNAQRLGADSALAFYCLSFINAGSTVGRVAAGFGDRVGRINLFTLALLSAAILMLAFWIPMTSVPQLIAFSVLYGFPAGIFISLTSACVAQISPPHMIGTRLGLLTAGAAVFALAGGPISGALIAQFEQGYRWAGLFSGSVLVIGAAFAAAARLVIQRRVMVVV